MFNIFFNMTIEERNAKKEEILKRIKNLELETSNKIKECWEHFKFEFSKIEYFYIDATPQNQSEEIKTDRIIVIGTISKEKST